MKQYGARLRANHPEKSTRTRAALEAARHERRAIEGQELEEEPFCEICRGPCTGIDLGAPEIRGTSPGEKEGT